MHIVLAADHAGFLLKEEIRVWLEEQDYIIQDVGVFGEESADYPLLAEKAGKIVQSSPKNRGIFFCGSGNGMALVANKIDGIRAINARSASEVHLAREDGDINVVALGGRVLIAEEAKTIIERFLETAFSGEEKRLRRLAQIKKIEEAT